MHGPRRALPPGTAPTAAADSPLEIMCCGRERLNRPRRSAGAGTAQQPGAATPVSRLRRASSGSGDASAPTEPAWHTHRTLSHLSPSFFFAPSSSPPSLFLSAALGRWKQPCPRGTAHCLSPRTAGHRRGMNGFRGSVGGGGPGVQEWNNQFQSPSKDLICLWHINSKRLFN